MLNFFLADRVKELSHLTGTGPITLDGAAAGFSGFDDIFASGDLVFYAITDNQKYEVGSGVYEQNGSTRTLTRNVIRSSNLNIGPYYVDGTSNSGPTDGQNGNFHPLWLSRSAAVSGVGFDDGPYSGPVSGISFDEFPGQTFYYVPEHFGSAEPAHAALSGISFNLSSNPVDFVNDGIKEVFVTYPGKTAVYNAYGIDPSVKEPQKSGIAFWANEQILNYASGLFWDNDNDALGVRKHNPAYAIDVGGDIDFSVIRASGFIDGGSGILFSGVVGSYSGGRQLEPFLRNELNNETGTDAVFELSGVVDQGILFQKQLPRTFFVGPSGECGCVDDYPVFRELVASDLDPIIDDLDFVIQNNDGLSSFSEYPFIAGQIAVYKTSGEITYESGLYYDANNKRLGINGFSDGYLVPQYVLHVSGDMAAQSGTFDQLLFTDNLVRIGENAGSYTENICVINIGRGAGQVASGVEDGVLIGSGTANGLKDSDKVILIGRSAGSNARYTDSVIGIGSQSAQAASGLYNITIVGSGAGWGAKQVDRSFIGGPSAGSGLQEADSVVGLGWNVMANASGLTDVVAAGKNAVRGSQTVSNAQVLGMSAGSGSFNLSQVSAVGNLAANEASGLTNVVAVGQHSARYAETLDDVVAIGRAAAQSGLELGDTVAVGTSAGSQASGNFNIYFGANAGASLSGNENIEIIASGASLSFLTNEASGKLNIGNTIVGDIYQGRVKVGSPSDASPDATFEVRPDNAEEIGLLVRHVGSGGSEPYFALQSGDATTFFHINNSGDVITSGCVNPSGGILFSDVIPQDITNKLYNDGGTLKWNGAAVDVGAGTSWYLSNDQLGASVGQNITTDQTVTISGVSGVTIDQIGRYLQISAGELSGVLQPQITNSLYTFDVGASGYDARNNDPATINQGDIVLLSGVSGVHVDFETRYAGGQRSGIFVIGYDPTITYSFSAVASGNGGQNNTPKSMVNDSVLAISGVSGINIDFENRSDGTNESGVFILGFTDEYWSKASGEWNYSQILENTASGFAISGISEWASGEFGRLGLGGGTKGTSGIIFQDDHLILDPQGSGSLARLYLNDAGSYAGSQVITDGNPNAASSQYAVLIGTNVAKNSVGYGAVVIGSGAGANAATNEQSVNIGVAANSGTNDSSRYSVNIGPYTGRGMKQVNQYCTNIGYEAGSEMFGSSFSINIGANAGYQSSGNSAGICIGSSAGYIASGCEDLIAIGDRAAEDSFNSHQCNFVGYLAGYRSSGLYRSAGFGWQALLASHDLDLCVGVGTAALQSATGCNYTVAIGASAGYATSGSDNSVYIGNYAGRNRSGNHNIFIGSHDTSFYPDDYYYDYNKDHALKIGYSTKVHMIGVADQYLHIGSNGVGDKNQSLYGDLTSSALNLTPHGTTKSALYLRPVSSQSSSLMKTKSLYGATYFDTNIINKNGQLLVQVANSKSGNDILTAGGNVIPRATAGQIALYETASNTGIAILCQAGGALTWKYLELGSLP